MTNAYSISTRFYFDKGVIEISWKVYDVCKGKEKSIINDNF